MRASMSDDQRLAILDEVIGQALSTIPDDEVEDHWTSLGAAEALDRLQAGYQELSRGLFAYHRKWWPWRNRELRGLVHLDWVPQSFHDTPAALVAAAGHDFDAYRRRATVLRSALNEFLEMLRSEGLYGDDPGTESFVRLHNEPGRAWNMDDWNAEHAKRHPGS